MNTMKKTLGVAAAVVTAVALSSTAQAQYNSGDLVLGFTTSASTGDLVINLGATSSDTWLTAGSGTTDLVSGGEVGYSKSTFVTALSANGLSLNSLTWGVVGGYYNNANNAGVYVTSTSKPSVPTTYGFPTSAIDTAGNVINGSSTPANTAVVDPTQGNGNSWKEAIVSTTGSSLTGTYLNPTTTTSSSFSSGTSYETIELYSSIQKSGVSTLTDLGYFTLGSDGSFTFTAVPEPATYGLLAGLGVLAVSLRRQLGRKDA